MNNLYTSPSHNTNNAGSILTSADKNSNIDKVYYDEETEALENEAEILLSHSQRKLKKDKEQKLK